MRFGRTLTRVAAAAAALTILGCGGSDTLSNQQVAQKLVMDIAPAVQSVDRLQSVAQGSPSRRQLASALKRALRACNLADARTSTAYFNPRSPRIPAVVGTATSYCKRNLRVTLHGLSSGATVQAVEKNIRGSAAAFRELLRSAEKAFQRKGVTVNLSRGNVH